MSLSGASVLIPQRKKDLIRLASEIIKYLNTKGNYGLWVKIEK
jgi:hypothetical protein